MTLSQPIWRSAGIARASLPLMLALAAVFAAMRFLGVLGLPGTAQLRALLPVGFVLMMAAPWLLMDRAGRRQIGLTRTASPRQCALAMLFGALAALACFGAGVLLFGTTADNWYMTIAASYRANMNTTHLSLTALYLIFTIPAILFSPVGEEIFFRGMLQQALEEKFSVRASTVLECAAFGVVHLCHHGLIVSASGLSIRPVSAILWMGAMFLVALLFASIRKRSGSLLPAILSHAVFNAVMNATIFVFLWRVPAG
jgi:hypothetical protein